MLLMAFCRDEKLLTKKTGVAKLNNQSAWKFGKWKSFVDVPHAFFYDLYQVFHVANMFVFFLGVERNLIAAKTVL